MSRSLLWLSLAVVQAAGIGFVSVALGQAIDGADQADLTLWHVSLSTGEPEYLVRMPVHVVLTYRNKSRHEQSLVPCKPYSVNVRRNEGAVRQVQIFQTRLEQTADIDIGVVKVAPGASTEVRFPLLLEMISQTKNDFMFPEPGQWTIDFPALKASTTVRVVSPEDTTDLAAMELIDTEVAEFISEEWVEPSVKERALKVCEKYPDSAYAPMCAITWAEDMGRSYSDPTFDFATYSKLLNGVIERHHQSGLRDKAFYLLVEGYVHRQGGLKMAAELTSRLAEEYPGSAYLKILEKDTRLRPGAVNEPPAAKAKLPKLRSGPEGFEGIGFDKIPAGPRRSLERFWQAVVQERFDDAFSYVAEDFQADEGSREKRREIWDNAAVLCNSITFKLEVTACKPITRLVRPLDRFDFRRGTWEGELLEVRGNLSATYIKRVGGEKRVDGPVPLTLVMQRDGETWKMVSEHALPPNQIAPVLTNELLGSLKENVGATKVYRDGKEERLVDLIASAAGPDLKISRPQWHFVAMDMLGSRRDHPALEGVLTSEDKHITERLEIKLLFHVKDERLELEKLDVTPAKP